MGDSTGKIKLWFRIAGMLLCILPVSFLALKIYLATPFSAPQLSQLLTAYLHQTVAISALRTTGGSLYLQGVSLANPPGFPAGNLATADSIAIAPQWGKLLLGRQGFRLIALEGVKLDIRKDSTGHWNYSGLQRMFANKKPSARETFIKRFVIKNGSFQVNSQGVKGISLQIFNLATLGSGDSRIELAFDDAARNHYAITGKARPGKEPAFDLALSAPSLSLSTLAKALPMKNAALLEAGRANLQVNAGLQAGQLQVRGTLGFNQVSLPIARRMLPLTGILSLKADYDLHNDQARIEALNLNINNLFKLYLTGTASSLRSERNYSANIDMGEVNLAALTHALPEQEQRRLVLGGTLGNARINISGNARQGLTGANGNILLQDGSLARDGRRLVNGLDGIIRLSRQGDGFLVNGKLSLRNKRNKALLEAINAPFSVNLSRRLKLLSAESQSLSAKVMGIPIMGRLGFDASATSPLSASLRIPETSLSTLQPLLDRFNLKLASGTGSLALEAGGQGPQEFAATTTVHLATLQGQRGKTAFAVKNGTLNSHVSWSKHRLSVTGNVQANGLAANGKKGDASFAYRFADRVAVLDHAVFRLGITSASIARLTAQIPVKETRQGTLRYPLILEFNGADIQQAGAVLSGLSGSIRGSYASGLGGKWLEGTADVASGLISWQGKPIGSPAAHIAFSPSGARLNLSGPLLGGELLGNMLFNPFALEQESRFTLNVKKLQLARAGALVPKQKSITLTDGLLEGSLSGAYSRLKGFACVFEAKGSAIKLDNNVNKTMLSGAGLGIAGELSGDLIAIREAVFTAGEGLTLTATGKLANAFSPQRAGAFSYVLPQTSFNNIIDPFINILPRFLQEATLDGSLAAQGTIELHDSKKLLNGEFSFKDGRLEVPAQKFIATDINGSLPVSLDFSNGKALPKDETFSFNRENYQRLLQQLRQLPIGNQPFSIGKISFGPLEFGTLTLHVKADNGITEITSLSTSLNEGSVLGRGFVAVKKGLQYRGDFLLHDMSLMQLCNRFPAIKGYISGRLDGVISLYGDKKGLEGLTGFTDLWAREGSGEKMLVSKEFLQRMAGKKLRGFFFRDDRPYDQAEISATLEEGYLTFETLDIVHTNFFGIRDLSVSIAPSQNRIALDHLFNTIKQATVRGKAVTGEDIPTEAPIAPEFKWQE
ncbi:MAG: hypothetical protein A2X79_05275 [Desulfuromonadaceae bacterium GWB2_53_15]|nr:MAG: hypothetical protein A2X79_05275 [Desulfuromonadaceae bacterium GWB2_53_15]